ncbi:hypothetical protein Ga0123461_1191 [Mariprofundus aestuarium]|uniref:Uncharacterized protein n=1 Tax=Mariprofundus aestuarium TaxID=1921086 RepID=A0A2K8KXD1_MARES|nr:hypothetical protein Ga0123461_1191 [Mariprofundus aestuarium]
MFEAFGTLRSARKYRGSRELLPQTGWAFYVV